MNNAKTPWHIWVVGVVSLLWHAGGAMDYIMSKTGNENYLAQMTPEQLAFLESFPAWLTPFWAVAVWGAVLGSLLILLRKKLAAPVFLIAFLAMIVVTIHNLFLADPSAMDMMNAFQLVFTVVIFIVAILMVIYSSTQSQLGRLR